MLILAGESAADLRTPAWYSEAGGSWHYRVPVQIPAGAATGSTMELNVDFAALLGQLGINAAAVDFDENSPRIVRPNGTLAVQQEFTDNRFNNALDAAGNARGEVRFLLQETGTGYFLYFDITQNGTKPASPAAVINGHFEQSAGGVPTGWVTSAINAGGNQNNNVVRTNAGATTVVPAGCSTNNTTVAQGPNIIGGSATGAAWHLLGYRDQCEDGSGNELIRLSRNIDVPAGAAAGVLEFYFNVQAWDGISNANNYDWFVVYVNGVPVDHTSLGIVNSPAPFLVIQTNRFGRNGFNTTFQDFGWKRAQLNLAAFAGTNINIRFEARFANDNAYRSWMRLDDVRWSAQTATLGTAQGFGANVISPRDTAVTSESLYATGQTLRLQAVTDATATQVTADVIDPTSAVVASGVLLFDDGTHGDLVPGDGVWTNDGSVPGQPTYTFSAAENFGANWVARVFARDASTAVSGTNGLLRITGAPATPVVQANYWNVDEQVFEVAPAVLDITKVVQTVDDPTRTVAGSGNPKNIPGAWVQYEVQITNRGADPTTADTITITDTVPAELSMCVSAGCTCVGIGCSTADPVIFDDSGSPLPTGLSYDYATNVSYSTDGVNFNYSPNPDADGFDPAVRFVRITVDGSLSASDGVNDPEFQLRYTMRLE